jgi:hypothetical protein
MRTLSRAALLMLVLIPSALWAQPPGVTLVGKGLIDGHALDLSGLTGNICQAGVPTNCIPKAIFGGFGSDVTYTGHDNVFIAAPDRGPFDGLTDVPYLNRVHFLHITTDVGAALPNINLTLLDTRFLKKRIRQNVSRRCWSFCKQRIRHYAA